MVDLEPAKANMYRYIFYVVVLGGVLIVGNLLFKKLERWLRRKRR